MFGRSKRTVALCCLLAVAMAYYYFALFLPYSHARLEEAQLNRGYHFGFDLYPLWLTSGQIVKGHTNPYGPESTKQIQIGQYGRPFDRQGDRPPAYCAFVYPVYADLLLYPFFLLPFPAVQVIGAILFPLMALLACLLWLRFLKLHPPPALLLSFSLLTLTSYPVLVGIYALQPSLLVALLIAGTALSLAQGRLLLAGCLLALSGIKPQLVLLLGVWLVMWAASDFKRRRKFVYGFGATSMLLLLAAQLAVPGWIALWTVSLLEYRHYNDPPLSLFAFGTFAGSLLNLGLISVAAFVALRSRRAAADSAQFATTLSYLLAITVLIIPSTIAVYDQFFLVPSILWLGSRKREILAGSIPSRIMGFAALSAISWPWVTSAGLIVASFVFSDLSLLKWILLPLRLVASLPFFVVALWLFQMWKGKLVNDATQANWLAQCG